MRRASSVVDEEGKPLVGISDAELLGGKRGDVLTRLFLVAERLNGLSVAAVEAAEGN